MVEIKEHPRNSAHRRAKIVQDIMLSEQFFLNEGFGSTVGL